jgi:hypothetical protein
MRTRAMIKIDQSFLTEAGKLFAADSKVAFPGCDIQREVLPRNSELAEPFPQRPVGFITRRYRALIPIIQML